MKPTPDTAISERQLAGILTAGGRKVAAGEISGWRSAGLMPPLTSHGLGQGKGKSHCWHHDDIIAQAQFVFDIKRQYGRNDLALLMLFLSGFAVPLPQLRRAWTSRARLCRPPAIRQAPRIRRKTGAGHCGPLLEIAFAIGGAIQTDHHIRLVPLLERALAKLGFARGGDTGQLCRMLMAMEPALEASGLIGAVDDMQMIEAQRYLVLGLEFLRECAERDERESLTAIAGPSLFIFILTLLHSGQRATIDALASQIEGARLAPVPAAWQAPRHAASPAGMA